MNIGIPKEVKSGENRVALTPREVKACVEVGATVFVQRGAGLGSGHDDTSYRLAGAKIVGTAKDVFKKSELILKVKEPQVSEYALIKSHHILFTFLHLAANPALERELIKKKVRALAYELVQKSDGTFPILSPMSEIAGYLSVMMGSDFLRKDMGGKGSLLPAVGQGGTGHVTILGAGQVGASALKIAHGIGASVTVYDINRVRLESLARQYPERLEILSEHQDLKEVVKRSDLLVGAVLVPGKRAPCLVWKDWVKLMEKGSVVVDVAIDQGGCIETSRVTTPDRPVQIRYGVLHSAVPNLPSLVGRTSTQALAKASFPYVRMILEKGFASAVNDSEELRKSLVHSYY